MITADATIVFRGGAMMDIELDDEERIALEKGWIDHRSNPASIPSVNLSYKEGSGSIKLDWLAVAGVFVLNR